MNKKASAAPMSALMFATAIAVITTGVALSSCSKKDPSASAAMTVNGEAITASDIDEASEFFRRQQVVLSPGELFEGGGGADFRRAAARQLAANVLLLAEVKHLGWRADSARVNAAIARFVSQFPTKDTFLSQLSAMGESEESMRRGIEEELLLDSLLRKISYVADSASDEECRSQYDADKERYKEPGKARASHIVFELEQTASDSEVRAAMERANVALTKARGGADFDALIKEYSPKAGGDIGWIGRGDLVPDLERKIFSMKKGEVSDPMPSAFGIHIIKKTDEKEPRQLSYAEAEAGIRTALTERKKTDKVNAYVDSLIGAANIKYMDTTLAPAREVATH